MRTELKKLGVGTKVIIYGQYRKVGKHGTILITNVFNMNTREFLCDHLWLNKYRVPWNKRHDDFVVAYGTIYEYQKGYIVDCDIDYNVNPIAAVLIRPLVFHNKIVYMVSLGARKPEHWTYSYKKGFNSETEFYTFETDEISHLFTGNDEEKGYDIINETDDYYDIYYENKDSKLRVYKSLDRALDNALSHIEIIE